MNANCQYLQLLCQFKIAMRRQAIHIHLEDFIHDPHYQQRCIH